MTAAETSEYAQYSAEKAKRGLEIVQSTVEKAEELATAENVQRGIDFVQDKIERAEEFASSEKVQRGIDFVQDKIDRAEAVALVVDDVAVVTGTETAKTRRRSRRVLIIGGVLVVGVIVAVVIVRNRKNVRPADDIEDAAEETPENPA